MLETVFILCYFKLLKVLGHIRGKYCRLLFTLLHLFESTLTFQFKILKTTSLHSLATLLDKNLMQLNIQILP